MSLQARYVNADVLVDASVQRVSGRTPIARWFFAAMAVITIVPLVAIPLALGPLQLGVTAVSPRMALVVLAVTGSMHVGSTAFFYFDRDFRSLIRDDRLRFAWSPALVPVGLLLVGVAGAVLVGSWSFFAVFAAQTTWLFYHYQRQNFGLISLVSTNAGSGPVPRPVGLVLNVVALAGLVATVGHPGLYPAGLHHLVPPEWQPELHRCGVVLYALSVPLLVSVFWRHPSLRRDPWLALAVVLGWAFFLPTVVGNALGFVPLAVAHGAQYVFMMTILAARSSRRWLGVVLMGGLAAAIRYTIDGLDELPAMLLGVGIVQVHFLLDAKVWRLREPRQRAIMNRRFDFLLTS